MEKFKKFEIQKKEIILGGSVGGGEISTKWYGLNSSGEDVYDPYSDYIQYL